MDVVLRGTRDGDGEPIMLMPPSVLHHRVLPGPVPKLVVESLQTFRAVAALTAEGFFGSEAVEVLNGSDPPDRYLHVRGRRLGLELTTVTVQDLRRQLARIRRAGRLLHELLEQGDRWAHLTGRVVHLADSPAGLSIDPAELAAQVATVLAEDKGYQGEGVNVSAGFPEQWPNDRGFYGQVAGVFVSVMHGDGLSAVTVVATAQAEFTRAELRRLVQEQVAAKDRPGNAVILLSAALLATDGYLCPLDQWLFAMLREHGIGEPLRLQFAGAVIVHNWMSDELLILHNSLSL